MKKTGFIFLAVILVATLFTEVNEMPWQTAHAETVQQGEITASSLLVRAEPSTDGNIISSFSQGEIVDLYEQTGSWYRVDVNGHTGYIHGDHVSVQESTGGIIGIGEVTASNLNVRDSASTNGNIISSLSNGTTVELYEQTGDWYRIDVNGHTGYIHSDYVTTSSSGGSDGSGGYLDGKTIFVDPGHGGTDPGATVGDIYEKTLTLQISEKVRDVLEQEGATVEMSRTTDTYVSLNNRADQANELGADLFISIHANSFTTDAATGSEVLYNESNNPGESDQLAQSIQNRIVSGLGMADRGIVNRELRVLTRPDMPSVLVEPGFMSNPSDMDMLQNQQETLAQEIVQGIINYYH